MKTNLCSQSRRQHKQYRMMLLGVRAVLKEPGFFLFVKEGPPTANSRQPPTAANRQRRPTTNRQPPPTATNHQSPTTNCRQPPPTATNRQLPTANRQPPPTMVEHRESPRAFLGNQCNGTLFFFPVEDRPVQHVELHSNTNQFPPPPSRPQTTPSKAVHRQASDTTTC